MSGNFADDVAAGVRRTVEGRAAPETGDRLSLAPHRVRPVSPAAYRTLAAHVGDDHAPDDAGVAAILAAGPAYAAWDGEELVGLARALSDGSLVAYVEEAVVRDGYRDQGLAPRLLAGVLDELAGVATVNLCCGPGTAPHYAPHGFADTGNVLLQRRRPEEAPDSGA